MSSSLNLTRREFVQATTAGTAIIAGVPSVSAQNKPVTRYCIVGVGSRSYMYQMAIQRTYKEFSELVGVCDTNEGRMKEAQAFAKNSGRPEPAIYAAADFHRMLDEKKPDHVIVTTIDGFHHEYIVAALQKGYSAISEKPMTIDENKCQQIIDAQRKSGKKLRVTFNYRYSPPRTQVKDLLMSGTIGDVLSVDFHWMLNTFHGADYFRRWHSQKRFSGGLMVHKATHHFDLVNWWLSAIPVSVMATGKRDYYRPEMAKRIGLQSHHERCHTCPEKDKCGFAMDLAKNPQMKRMYLDQEKYDGYFRDRCVFRPDIDIEDTMNVLVKYNTSVTMSYSLNAFNAWEGYYVIFNGTKGRLEHKMEEQVYVFGDGSVPGAIKGDGTYIRIYPLRDPAYAVDVWTGTGGHGGGDKVMLDEIFLPEKKEDKYMRAADQRSGAYSILTGIAANHCFKSGKEIVIADLVKNIGMPDYPTMPNHTDSLPMPAVRRMGRG